MNDAIVRRMSEHDIEAAAMVQVEAFGGTVERRVQTLQVGPRYTWQDGWMVEDAGELAATAIAMPQTWWLGGVPYPASAIAAVGVRAVARRRGFATQLMRAILHADLEQRRPFSLLYPFQHGFYQRLGYAPSGLTHFYRIPLMHIPDAPQLRHKVRMLSPDDHQSVYELYRWSLVNSSGGLERDDAHWQARWQDADERWVVYADGDVGGYLVYETIEDQLNLTEMIAATPEAERALWSFLAAQVEQRRAVTYHAPVDKPLWAMLREPLMYQGTRRGFVLTDAAHLTVGLMARIVDVEAACALRVVPSYVRGSVALSLHDPVLEENNATFTLQFDDGQIRAERSQTIPDATCDIVTLTQLFCGVLSASAAYWMGRLDTSSISAALLDQALGGPKPFIHPADWF